MKNCIGINSVLFCSLLAWTTPAVWADTQVIFTVDVESNHIPLPKQVDAQCSNGRACGLMAMVEMLQERGWAGTFFLNVYESNRWGEAAMRDIAKHLQSAGQDVALHTHPQWAYDPSRWAMFEYNLEEQTTAIRDGVRLLEAWTGLPVVAHRAGAYTADQNTLKALERSGIRIDSSLFWGHPWSRLNGLGMPRNLPSSWGGVIQIPVTVYQRDDLPFFFGDLLTPVTSIRKIDPDWFINQAEARAAIDAIIEADLPFLVVFLHSYSFLSKIGDDGVPVADLNSLENFDAMLERITDKGLSVVTMRDLAKSLPNLSAMPPEQDQVPRVTVRVGIHRYLWYRLKAIGMSAPSVLAAGALTLVSAMGLIILVRRRRLAAHAK